MAKNLPSLVSNVFIDSIIPDMSFTDLSVILLKNQSIVFS